ncbi:MAG: AraC family transcriptional regulator [Bacteroidota bacterium]
MTQKVYDQLPGIKAHIDPDNALNRIIYSSVKSFEYENWSDSVTIKYVLQGKEIYHLDGKEYPVNQGQLLLFDGARRVGVSIQEKEVVEGICIFLDVEMLAKYEHYQKHKVDQLIDQPAPLTSRWQLAAESYPAAFCNMSTLLERIFEHRKNLTLEAIDQYCWQFAALIWEHSQQAERQQQQIVATRKATREELYKRLLIAISYIHDHLAQKLRIAAIAQAACLSEFHLMRSFKQCFGWSMQQYIQHCRLEKAQRMMASKRYSLSQIALACGFADLQYFSRVFKKVHGVAPSRWEKR